MHVLRWLRIFIPLLLIAVLVAGAVVVMTSRSALQDSRRKVNDAWTQSLRRDLDARYQALKTANGLVQHVPGPLHQIVTETATDLRHWGDLESENATVASEVQAANDLEAVGRRLVAAALVTPRVKGDQAKLNAVDTYANRPLPASAATFDAAVASFEKLRSRPSYSLAARILGYDAIPDFDTGRTT